MKHTEETKRKMSESRMGHPTSDKTKKKIGMANGKAVRCVETNTIYYSAAEAYRQTGNSVSGITMCCNGKRKTCDGLHWEWVNDVQNVSI